MYSIVSLWVEWQRPKTTRTTQDQPDEPSPEMRRPSLQSRLRIEAHLLYSTYMCFDRMYVYYTYRPHHTRASQKIARRAPSYVTWTTDQRRWGSAGGDACTVLSAAARAHCPLNGACSTRPNVCTRHDCMGLILDVQVGGDVFQSNSGRWWCANFTGSVLFGSRAR